MAAPKGSPKSGGRKKGTPNKATADIRALAQVHASTAMHELAASPRKLKANRLASPPLKNYSTAASEKLRSPLTETETVARSSMPSVSNSLTLKTEIEFPGAFRGLFKPAPYKVFYGGRGSGKSWSIARSLILLAAQKPVRILCAREFQTSILDSVHKLLSDQIEDMGLSSAFRITDKAITSTAGAEFIFKGIRVNPNGIRSIEAVDRCWVEEAQVVSEESWAVLLPSLFRVAGCELIISFNPDAEADPTWKKFVAKPPPGSMVRRVGWEDNRWFPPGLDQQRRHMLETDPDAYDWIWNGHPRKISEAVIFRNRVSVETFDTPEQARFFFGADWGFANDPTTLVRSYVENECLFVDYEAFGFGTEIDDTPALFDRVPGARDWPIKGDSARPETISYMRRQGFTITAAEKWPNSVEDGVAHLKGFKRIVVHERCKHVAQEFRLYSYKVERLTNDILPIIVDKHNHGIDAIRYSLDGFIQGRGQIATWERLFA